MTPDRDVERRLEEWLDAEARPMPHEVLEGALESVARTPQTGSGGGAAWLRSRPLGMAATAVVLVVLVATGKVAVDRVGSWLTNPSATPVEPLTWNPTVDFGLSSNRLNPVPDSYGNPAVWSYLSSRTAHAPATYQLLPSHDNGIWNDGANEVVAYLDKGGILMHPWTSGDVVRFVILGWTSPVTAEVNIRGYVGLVDGNCTAVGSGIRLTIDHELEPLDALELASGAEDRFEFAVAMTAGESIYFVVDPEIDSLCDSTRLIVRISTVP